MPWSALPFSDRTKKTELSTKYGVRGIPTLVVLDAEGNIITKEGVASLFGDEEGESFPWRPRSFNDIMFDGPLITSAGPVNARDHLQGK